MTHKVTDCSLYVTFQVPVGYILAAAILKSYDTAALSGYLIERI